MWDYKQYLAGLAHYGVKGQKWGIRNGPPYPINRSDKKPVAKPLGRGKLRNKIVDDAIRSGEVSKTINREKQLRHTKHGHTPGRSYLDGDLEYAQELVDKLSGTGKSELDFNGNWNHKERVVYPHIIGTHVDPHDGTETKSNVAIIVYSKTGTHIYPGKRKENTNDQSKNT